MRRRWIASITSACCASTASPRILGPVELVAHHRKDVRRAGKRLDAVVPGLFVDLLFQGIALQILAFLQPAIGLHHLQWIGRRRQHICEQLSGYSAIGATKASSCSGFNSSALGGDWLAGCAGLPGAGGLSAACAETATGIAISSRARSGACRSATSNPPLRFIAASIGPRWGRSLIKIKGTEVPAVRRRKRAATQEPRSG